MFGLAGECSWVRGYLFTAWRAGVWGRGAGDVQGAGATAGRGRPSDPNEDTDSGSETAALPQFDLRQAQRLAQGPRFQQGPIQRHPSKTSQMKMPFYFFTLP